MGAGKSRELVAAQDSVKVLTAQLTKANQALSSTSKELEVVQAAAKGQYR
jgi:hypothetical protein